MINVKVEFGEGEAKTRLITSQSNLNLISHKSELTIKMIKECIEVKDLKVFTENYMRGKCKYGRVKNKRHLCRKTRCKG